jgi:hypothetical protein
MIDVSLFLVILIQYSQRHSVINHCDRCITLLSDTDISFALFTLFTYIYLPFVSPRSLRVQIPLRQGVLDTTLCDKVCQWLATGRWFSPGIPVSSTNKTDCHNITEIVLKVALNTITLIPKYKLLYFCNIWEGLL